MNKVNIIGNFALGTESYNGQTIKTRIVSDELERVYGAGSVGRADTAGGLSTLLRIPLIVWRSLRHGRNVVIMPAQNGIKVIVPLVVLMNVSFGRAVHYVVIGGWLPEFLQRHRWLVPLLRRVSRIYPETLSMKQALGRLGLECVTVLPNFKPLSIVRPDELADAAERPLRLCTFSRVTPTKGIGDAVEAVELCNRRAGRTVAVLDIYGDVEQREWFDALMAKATKAIRYSGKVDFGNSVSVLKEYAALLFPTYYPGEGHAGTIIDAFAAGLPVVASDWHDNANIVADGVDGLIFSTHSVEQLADRIMLLHDNPAKLARMKLACLSRAHECVPAKVIQTLSKYMQ